MPKDELIKRLRAGEWVTAYHPRTSYVGVGKRTFFMDPDEKDHFRIQYSDEAVSKYQHKLDSPLLDSLYRNGHMIDLWWVAYARSVALNQDAKAK